MIAQGRNLFDYLWPALVTLFLWWSSTGAIAWLVGRPDASRRWLLGVALVVATVALFAIGTNREADAAGDAWLAFVAALALWGGIEISFLTGAITGPRKIVCAPGCHGLRHALHACSAILWHELLIVITVGSVALLTLRGANPGALQTLLVLWVMRTSAKLNLFLGVRNLGEAFWPERLVYLKAYLRRRAMNPLMPVSLAFGVALTIWFAGEAQLPAASPSTTAMLLATLSALAVLEHVLMVTPLDGEYLWRWSLRGRRPAPDAGR